MSFAVDTRDGKDIAKYHRPARSRTPYAQTLLAVWLAPLLVALSRFSRKKQAKLPKGGYIVVANHHSVLDQFFVALAVRRHINFMGKSDFFRGLFGAFLSRMGSFPVQRGRWDQSAFDTACTVIEQGRVMCMFPEGGIHAQQAPAKPGVGYIAAIAGAQVLPVYIDGAAKMYKPWRLPRVKTIVGQPVTVEKNDNPSREQNQANAQAILDAVYALKP